MDQANLFINIMHCLHKMRRERQAHHFIFISWKHSGNQYHGWCLVRRTGDIMARVPVFYSVNRELFRVQTVVLCKRRITWQTMSISTDTAEDMHTARHLIRAMRWGSTSTSSVHPSVISRMIFSPTIMWHVLYVLRSTEVGTRSSTRRQ